MLSMMPRPTAFAYITAWFGSETISPVVTLILSVQLSPESLLWKRPVSELPYNVFLWNGSTAMAIGSD